MGPPTSFPTLLVLALVMAIAVYVELKENRIPNWLTFSGMALGLAISYVQGKPFFWSSLCGFAIGFGFLFLFYIFGGVGGGDVKLMGAAGALMGAQLIKPALFYTAAIGAFLALMMVIWRKDFWVRAKAAMLRLAFWRKGETQAAVQATPIIVPYGVAIAAGCLVALLIKGAL
jgi:prepilin peptidase CpaA